ncbi:hypothetical protein D3C76_1224880 [compost metagenome]
MQNLGHGWPVTQQFVQPQADQQQQQAEAQGGTGDMPEAGTQAITGTAAQGDDVDRTGGDGGGQRKGGHGQGQTHWCSSCKKGELSLLAWLEQVLKEITLWQLIQNLK